MDSKCDGCHLPFQVQVQERDHGKGVRESYFLCPHCKREYYAFITDDYIRQKQNKLKKLYKRFGPDTNAADFELETERIKKEIQSGMMELRGKYSNSPPALKS